MSGRPLDARELLVPPPALVHISLGQCPELVRPLGVAAGEHGEPTLGLGELSMGTDGV